MAIKINHNVPAAGLAVGGFLGGAGEYKKYLEKMAMQQAEMEQRERMQMRALQAEKEQQSAQRAQQIGMFQLGQQADAQQMAWKAGLAQQQMMWDTQQRQAMQDQAFARQKEMGNLDFQNRLALEDVRYKNMQAGYEADDARRLKEFEFKKNFDIQQKQSAFDAWNKFNAEDQELNQWRSGVEQAATPDGGGYTFSKQDQDRLAKIQAQRSAASNAIMNNAMTADQAREIHERLKREEMAIRPTQKIPTPQEQLEQRRVREEDPNTGRITEYIIDSKGEFKKQLPEKTNPELEREKMNRDLATTMLKSDNPSIQRQGMRIANTFLPDDQKFNIDGGAEGESAQPQNPPPPPAAAGAAKGDPANIRPPQDAMPGQPPTPPRRIVPLSEEEKQRMPFVMGTKSGVPVIEDARALMSLQPGTLFINPEDGKMYRVPPR